MDIHDALSRLNVTDSTLTREERLFLDQQGFLPLHGILTPPQIEAIRLRVDDLLGTEGEEAGKEVHQEKGTQRLADLVNKGPVFDVFYTHPRVLAGITHVLRGNLKLSSLNGRIALPGEGLQPLHADWPEAVGPNDFRVCNSIWLLDDFTEDNGATRVVPGTHLSGKMPQNEMTDPSAPHPQEVKLQAPAGTVVIFNSHTWHGGTRNTSPNRRRALHSYFCRRNEAQQLDQAAFIRPETRQRLSEAARCILAV